MASVSSVAGRQPRRAQIANGSLSRAKADYEPKPPDGGRVTQLRVESELIID